MTVDTLVVKAQPRTAYGLIALAPLVAGMALGWRALPVGMRLRRTGRRKGARKRRVAQVRVEVKTRG